MDALAVRDNDPFCGTFTEKNARDLHCFLLGYFPLRVTCFTYYLVALDRVSISRSRVCRVDPTVDLNTSSDVCVADLGMHFSTR